MVGREKGDGGSVGIGDGGSGTGGSEEVDGLGDDVKRHAAPDGVRDADGVGEDVGSVEAGVVDDDGSVVDESIDVVACEANTAHLQRIERRMTPRARSWMGMEPGT